MKKKESCEKPKTENYSKAEEIPSIGDVYQKFKEKIPDKANIRIPQIKKPNKNDILNKSIKTLSKFVTEETKEENIEMSMQSQEDSSNHTTLNQEENIAGSKKTKPEDANENAPHIEEYDDSELDDFWKDEESAYTQEYEDENIREEIEFGDIQEDEYPEETEMDLNINDEFLNSVKPEPKKFSEGMKRQSNMKNL